MTPAIRPLIAGNWKMNGLLGDGEALVRGITDMAAAPADAGCDILVCPPATLLYPLGRLLAGTPVALGGQDCHAGVAGAYTGDISATMLRDAGCRYVILGHSERRAAHHETSELVAEKAAAALAAGLMPLICVGESEAERDQGHALSLVTDQIRRSLPGAASAATTIIAYEPIWAIGTGRSASPADIEEMHAAIRLTVASILPDGQLVRILYGGSVKADNAEAVFQTAGVDGALVGGASLDAAAFWSIVEAARRVAGGIGGVGR